MCIQEWLGLVSNFHLMHILLSYSQLEQTLCYIQTKPLLPQLCFGRDQCNHLLGKWDHHSWLEKENRLFSTKAVI